MTGAAPAKKVSPVISSLALLALCTAAFGPPATQPAGEADPVDKLVRDEMADQHIPGLSLAVVKDGLLLKAAGYGLANVELNVPATPETVYQIQSITKTFTATATMMLVEEGKVRLEAKVDDYLDGTPETWKDITILNLLTHTSGIKDFINEPTASLRLDVTEQEVFRATVARPLNFPPGEKYAYSNTNYHLLAMIIRKLSGQFYGDFLRDRIFEPLGMTHTRIISHAEIIPHRAAGYLWHKGLLFGSLRNGEYVAGSILGYGGGGIRSTVLDMARWDAALYGERLLKRSSLEQMWTPARLNNGRASGYGFGWGIHSMNGHRCLSHSGGHVTGFATVIQRYVDDGLTVIVLSNLRGANTGRIAERVARCYLPGLAGPTSKPGEGP